MIIKEKIKQGLAVLFVLIIPFILVGWLIRMYEYIIIHNSFILPESAVALFLSGVLFDLLYLSLTASLFGLFFLAFYYVHQKAAVWSIGILMILFLIVYAMLVQYFGEGLTPLGADFFAYSLSEISDTVNTSVELTVGRIIPLILVPVLFFSFYFGILKLNLPDKISVYGIGCILLMGVSYLFLYPSQSQYEREVEYNLVANKSSIFYGHAKKIFFGNQIAAYSGDEYPLIRVGNDEDPLGEYLDFFSRSPNIVFIIVESLGASVMSPHGRYQGFAPYLESLADESLNWTHFLSTSGRSFNVQPSLLASLPYGEQGFMELGYRAPDHHSLFTILNNNDYHTAYFCGYNSRFDKLDLFLEQQQIDLLIDQSHFDDSYQKMDEIEGGFTWGYSDKDTYKRAFEEIDTFDSVSPRLDVFFTLNFHEPFIIPENEFYRERFYEQLETLEISENLRDEFIQYQKIFSALMYTDDAIKELMARYSERPDYENTIFVITGDHRMIPVPHATRIDRYHVPFMIYSPRLKQPQVFKGVSSHLDVTPSLVQFLSANYGLQKPDQDHWMGGALNTSKEFSVNRNIPLMRNKNEMDDYISDNFFLSGNQLFEISDGMKLTVVEDQDVKLIVQKKQQNFMSMNRYVTTENKLMPVSPEMENRRKMLEEEEQYFSDQNLLNRSVDQLFNTAREMAFTGEYEESRRILRRVLRENPNNHDARLLFGRTYGWENEYELAEEEFRDVLLRNDSVIEAYAAIADLYFWQAEPDMTLSVVNKGLQVESNNIDLLFRKARAYNQLGQKEKAAEVVQQGLELSPEDENLLNLGNQL